MRKYGNEKNEKENKTLKLYIYIYIYIHKKSGKRLVLSFTFMFSK